MAVFKAWKGLLHGCGCRSQSPGAHSRNSLSPWWAPRARWLAAAGRESRMWSQVRSTGWAAPSFPPQLQIDCRAPCAGYGDYITVFAGPCPRATRLNKAVLLVLLCRGVAGGRQLQGRWHGPGAGRVAGNLPGPAGL